MIGWPPSIWTRRFNKSEEVAVHQVTLGERGSVYQASHGEGMDLMRAFPGASYRC